MARAALIVMVTWFFVSGEGMAKKPPKDDTPPQEEITPLPEDVMPPPEGDIEELRQENAQLQAEIDLLNDDIAQLKFVSADNKKVKAEKDLLAADNKKIKAEKDKLAADNKKVKEEKDKLAVDHKKVKEEKDKLDGGTTASSQVVGWQSYPSNSGYYVVAYEDMYPSPGDYDFNDLAVAYRLQLA